MLAGWQTLLTLLSARAAYLNLLYSKWLEVDGDEVKYDSQIIICLISLSWMMLMC